MWDIFSGCAVRTGAHPGWQLHFPRDLSGIYSTLFMGILRALCASVHHHQLVCDSSFYTVLYKYILFIYKYVYIEFIWVQPVVCFLLVLRSVSFLSGIVAQYLDTAKNIANDWIRTTKLQEKFNLGNSWNKWYQPKTRGLVEICLLFFVVDTQWFRLGCTNRENGIKS